MKNFKKALISVLLCITFTLLIAVVIVGIITFLNIGNLKSCDCTNCVICLKECCKVKSSVAIAFSIVALVSVIAFIALLVAFVKIPKEKEEDCFELEAQKTLEKIKKRSEKETEEINRQILVNRKPK